MQDLLTVLAKPIGAVAAAGFTPADLASLVVWRKADLITSLWTDSARSVQVASDGDAVGAWDDLSGSEYHVIQSSSPAKGTYKTGIAGGLPIVRYAASDFLENLTKANWRFLHDGSDYTIFFVVYLNDADIRYGLYGNFDGNASGQIGTMLIWDNRSASSRIDRAQVLTAKSSGSYYLSTAVDNTWLSDEFGVVAIRYENGAAGFDLNFFNNGGVASPAVDDTGSPQAGDASDDWREGNSGTVASLAGDIAEVIICNIALPDDDMNNVGNYLERWPLTWTDI